MIAPIPAPARLDIERLTTDDGMSFLLVTVHRRHGSPSVLHITQDPDTGEAVALDADSWSELARHADETQLLGMVA